MSILPQLKKEREKEKTAVGKPETRTLGNKTEQYEKSNLFSVV